MQGSGHSSSARRIARREPGGPRERATQRTSCAADHKLRQIGPVVAELRESYPDITHSSLRFLEREGLVTPTRTPGGHRLYTLRDVERVRQIKTWQAQRLSLADIRTRLAALEQIGSADELAQRFVQPALGGDLATAARGIRQAAELGVPLPRLLQSVLRPALYEVGDLWQRGKVRVGQEHEVSALAGELIAELSPRQTPPEPRGPVAIAACVAGERHDLGLRVVSALLRAEGWRVHYLGPDVAPRFIVEEVGLRHPDVVLLSATMEERLPAMQETVAALRAGREAWPVVAVGGQGISRRATAVRSWGAVPITGEAIVADLRAALDKRRPATPRGAAAGGTATSTGPGLTSWPEEEKDV